MSVTTNTKQPERGITMDQAFDEGFKAHRDNEWLDANPYMRPSGAWKQWREGWAHAEWETWQAEKMAKRKSRTE